MLPKIKVNETMETWMDQDDRMYKQVAEIVIHQFESEPTNGIVTTSDPTNTVDNRTLSRRFREFCKGQFPDLDDWALWRWYRHYLVQERRYVVRQDHGYGIHRFTGFDAVIPRAKYQQAGERKPRPQLPKVSDLVEYSPEHGPGTNGHGRLN